MALIKCSECDNEISSKAASCPNCGNPVKTKGGKEKPQVIKVKSEAGCGTVFMAIIVFFLASVLGTAILTRLF